MDQLKDKVAIVTGASSGIGRAAALLFAAEGARVVVSGRRRDALDAVVADIALAGGQAIACAGDLTLDGWRDTLDTNLTSAFLAAKYQVPALKTRGGGALVFTSSFVGYTLGFPGMAAYAAAKAGLIGLVQVLAAELGTDGIRVNALLPGGTDTPANHANAPGAGPEVRAFIEGLHALKRLASPDEIARAALFLASEQSSFVTGAAILADGGVSITRT